MFIWYLFFSSPPLFAADFWTFVDPITVTEVTKTGADSFSSNIVSEREDYGNITNWVTFDPMMNRIWTTYSNGIASVNNISGIYMDNSIGPNYSILGIDKAGTSSKLFLSHLSSGSYFLKKFDLLSAQIDDTSFSAYTNMETFTFEDYAKPMFFMQKRIKRFIKDQTTAAEKPGLLLIQKMAA